MSNNLMVLRERDLIENPTTRLPVCLCVDTSGSMNRTQGGVDTGRTTVMDNQTWNVVEGGTTAIDELNTGIQYFFDAIKSDEIARYSVELAVVSFNSKAETISDFSSVDLQEIELLSADGTTSMGHGVNLALDLLEQRKSEYSSKGVDYYQPWLVLMTDGDPTDDISNAVNRVQKLYGQKKLTVFSIAIGEDASIDTLKKFSSLSKSMVLKVKSPEHFKEFFEWLSQSVSVASQSVPGDKPSLPPTPPVIEIEL